jgi:(2S)-methylsuccinyl-CoA dehydrogenase
MAAAITSELAAYQAAWRGARAAAADATSAWAERCRAEITDAIARACATDQSADGLGPEFERVAELALSGTPVDDLGLPDEYRFLRSTLREFATREVKPRAQAIHRQDDDVPDAIIRGIAELGLFGTSIPSQYGGSQTGEPDYLAMLIGTEELSAASLAAAGSLMTRPEILVRALLSGGTEEQRRRWLPGIASGDQLVAVAVTEPNFGSDVAGIRCRAQKGSSGSWVVNGTKLWCTFAGRAHLLTLLCRSGDEADHRGLSLFVAEKPSFHGKVFEHRQPSGGLLRGRAIPTIGYRGLHTFELLFQDYRLPPESLVGREGQGFYLQMHGFSVGRLQTAARGVGLMHAAIADALGYAQRRHVFGRPISDHELQRLILGRMLTRLHASRQLSYAAARLLDADGGAVQASLAKLYAARMAEYVTRDAMQVFGGMGYGEETDVSRYFVDARVLTIFEGTEEVLALRVIANALDKAGAA